jgi:hypothetical protein
MRAYVHMAITEFDHPHVQRDNEGDLIVHLGEGISLVGSDNQVARWLREAAIQLAQLED